MTSTAERLLASEVSYPFAVPEKYYALTDDLRLLQQSTTLY